MFESIFVMTQQSPEAMARAASTRSPSMKRKGASGFSPKASSGLAPKSRRTPSGLVPSFSSIGNCVHSMSMTHPSATPSQVRTASTSSAVSPLGNAETMTSGHSGLGTKLDMSVPPQM